MYVYVKACLIYLKLMFSGFGTAARNLEAAFYSALIKSLSDIYRAVVTAPNGEIST